ncbi:hypothetical protein PVAP13_9NG215500 [Panicum virgatum]|uniref:Uncharacterized protein n=1 Tax=Panicum virgatum TaxID=38727 RepID=A0A8T0MKW3_PANVG|nr:hypothetical protein PVAP13_9NG215500 [Panicum virgatum]
MRGASRGGQVPLPLSTWRLGCRRGRGAPRESGEAGGRGRKSGPGMWKKPWSNPSQDFRGGSEGGGGGGNSRGRSARRGATTRSPARRGEGIAEAGARSPGRAIPFPPLSSPPPTLPSSLSR